MGGDSLPKGKYLNRKLTRGQTDGQSPEPTKWLHTVCCLTHSTVFDLRGSAGSLCEVEVRDQVWSSCVSWAGDERELPKSAVLRHACSDDGSPGFVNKPTKWLGGCFTQEFSVIFCLHKISTQRHMSTFVLCTWIWFSAYKSIRWMTLVVKPLFYWWSSLKCLSCYTFIWDTVKTSRLGWLFAPDRDERYCWSCCWEVIGRWGGTGFWSEEDQACVDQDGASCLESCEMAFKTSKIGCVFVVQW